MISWRLIIRCAPFALLPLVNANQVPVKTGLDRRHNYCRQSCAGDIMGKLIEDVLTHRRIIVIISSLMQMISEIKETE